MAPVTNPRRLGQKKRWVAFHTRNQGRERAFEVVAFVDVVLEDVVFVDVGFEDVGFVDVVFEDAAFEDVGFVDVAFEDVAFEDVDRGMGLEKGGRPWKEKSRQGMGQACDG